MDLEAHGVRVEPRLASGDPEHVGKRLLVVQRRALDTRHDVGLGALLTSYPDLAGSGVATLPSLSRCRERQNDRRKDGQDDQSATNTVALLS